MKKWIIITIINGGPTNTYSEQCEHPAWESIRTSGNSKILQNHLTRTIAKKVIIKNW